MWTIQVIQDIDSGHKLCLPYSSKCNGWHGHRWKIIVTLFSKVLVPFGMVIDFTHVKAILKKYDHKFFLYVDDQVFLPENKRLENSEMLLTFNPLEFGGLDITATKRRGTNSQRTVGFDAEGILLTNFQPTAENLSQFFFQEIEEGIRVIEVYAEARIQVKSVELWETPSGSVVYTRSEE